MQDHKIMLHTVLLLLATSHMTKMAASAPAAEELKNKEELYSEIEAAVDHVLLRHERAMTPNFAVRLQMRTTPESVRFHPGETIQIRCSVQADLTVNDFMYMSFYREFDQYTHMSLSSGDPDVKVEPTVPTEEDFIDFDPSDNDNVIYNVKILTLGPEAYDSLDNGQNLFYCKSATRSGVRKVSYFFIHRVTPQIPYNRRHPRLRQMTPPPRVY